jgi:hypothetical protein
MLELVSEERDVECSTFIKEKLQVAEYIATADRFQVAAELIY